MEVPELVVVQVVDAHSCADLLGDLVAHAHISGEVAAGALVGKAVHIGVVQRAVLLAAVARAQGVRPFVVRPVGGHGSGAPLGDATLPFAHAGRELVVAGDLGVRPGQAAAQLQPAHEDIGCLVRQFQALGADGVHVLHVGHVGCDEHIGL